MSIKKYYNIGKNILFPINRSLTGSGTKRTLEIIKKNFPKLLIKSTNSNKKCFDWKIPDEWNVTDAYVIDKYNDKIIDFKKNNLHLVGYSTPINKIITKKELIKHVHTLPKQPDAVPYITSYYKRYWGYCITDNMKKKMKKKYKSNDKFKINIKSSIKAKGKLNHGEFTIKGETKKIILISTNICHPSMANNELSGPIVAMCLMDFFSKRKNKKTIKFIFIPETIVAINYIHNENDSLKKYLDGGYILSCIGDERMYSCIFSKYKNSMSDKALIHAYKKMKIKYKEYSFLERGSDERQFNSPGIDLPVTAVFRSKFGTYKEYHTSLDNFNLVTIKGIKESFELLKKTIINLDNFIIPKAVNKCEPFMSKYNLYDTLSTKKKNFRTENLMNFLQYCDGKNDLKQISKLIGTSILNTEKIYKILLKNKLIY